MGTDKSSKNDDSTHESIIFECRVLKDDIANAKRDFDAEVDKINSRISKITSNGK